jgi:hypothetical protein
MTYSATGVSDAVTAQGAIVVSHTGEASETDTRGATPAPNCRVHANGDSTNDTSSHVTISIPFRIDTAGRYALTLKTVNIGENSSFTWNHLQVSASVGGLSCDAELNGRAMDSCLKSLSFAPGDHTLTVTVSHSSGMTVDSEAHPAELLAINDLFTAQFAPVTRSTTTTATALAE